MPRLGYERAMSARTCPDWPRLLELVPELHFKHYTLRDVNLPPAALAAIEDALTDGVALCCDVENRVFNPRHTEPRVAVALQSAGWFDLRAWARRPSVPERDPLEHERTELEKLRALLTQREQALA